MSYTTVIIVSLILTALLTTLFVLGRNTIILANKAVDSFKDGYTIGTWGGWSVTALLGLLLYVATAYAFSMVFYTAFFLV